MAAAAKPDGSANLIATARHIVRSLATSTPNAADDMLRILSGFDHRLSSFPDLLSPRSSLDEDHTAAEEPENEQSPDPSPQEPPSEAAIRLDAAEKVVLHWDPFNPDTLMWDSPDTAARYLAAVDEIISLVSAEEEDEDIRVRAESVLRVAIVHLQDEFRQLMVQNSTSAEPEVLVSVSLRRLSLSAPTFSIAASEDAELPPVEDQHTQQTPNPKKWGSTSVIDEQISTYIHPKAIGDLRDIASRIIAAGYQHDLRHAYSSVRRDILLESLAVLEADAVNVMEVQTMDWDVLDDMIKKWIQTLKFAVRVLLSLEQRLCNQILFDGSEEFREECFNDSCKLSIFHLFNFVDAIVMVPRSPEKIFRILGMYEALVEVLPDIQSKFSGDTKEFVCDEAYMILKKFGVWIQGTLTEFGNAVQGENAKTLLPGGEIHPMSRYVLNYLKFLAEYKDVLDTLLNDDCVDGGDNSEGAKVMTLLGQRIELLISYLEANLKEKCKLYEDPGLQYVFLMNNMLYIVQRVKDSDLKTLLGDHWVRKRRAQIKQYATSYLRASWTKVLFCLRDEGLTGPGGGGSGVSKTLLKERFKNFNLAFEELYKTQTTWRVSDSQLKEELRISISENVVPAYRSFMVRFGHMLEGSWHATKYIKYNAEEMERYLGDLFEGLPANSNSLKRKVSFA